MSHTTIFKIGNWGIPWWSSELQASTAGGVGSIPGWRTKLLQTPAKAQPKIINKYYIHIEIHTHTHTHIHIYMLLFTRQVVSDSLWPHGPQHARFPYPSPSLRVCPSSCPLNRWCHPTISSCCPLLLLPSVFPSIMSWLFASGGQSIGVSASASNECSRLISFRIDWFDLLAVQGDPYIHTYR